MKYVHIFVIIVNKRGGRLTMNKSNVIGFRIDKNTKEKLEKLKANFEKEIGIKITMSQYIEYLIKKHIEVKE